MVTSTAITQEIVNWHKSIIRKGRMVPKNNEKVGDAIEVFVDYLSWGYLLLPSGKPIFVEKTATRKQNSSFSVTFRVGEQFFRIQGWWDGGEDWDNARILEVFAHPVTTIKLMSANEIKNLES